jgi:hypothetical protein
MQIGKEVVRQWSWHGGGAGGFGIKDVLDGVGMSFRRLAISVIITYISSIDWTDLSWKWLRGIGRR